MRGVRNPYARPVGEYVKETAAMNKHVHPVFADALAGFLRPDREEVPGRDDISRCAEMAALDDVVNANIRQMAGPWPIADKDGD